MKRFLLILGLALSTSLTFATVAESQEITANSEELLQAARQQMATTLAEGATPEAWDAALFVSAEAVSGLLSKFEGTSLSFPTRDQLPAAVIAVRSIVITPQIAAIRARLEMGARIDGLPFPDFVVPAEALFFVSGFEEDAETGVTSMVISPKIVLLGPTDLVASLPWRRSNSSSISVPSPNLSAR